MMEEGEMVVVLWLLMMMMMAKLNMLRVSGLRVLCYVVTAAVKRSNSSDIEAWLPYGLWL